jgi:hypothetical protein
MRQWVGEDQVRLNAIFALLNAINDGSADKAAIEDTLMSSLEDPNGYVPILATEALSRLDSHSAHRAALGYLRRHAWDDSLAAGVRIY